MAMTLRTAILAAAFAACVPAAARAVTPQDLVALSQAGLSDEVLIAVIDADRTIFDLNAEQILTLSRAGVSDTVLRKMLGSRREFEPAPRADVVPDVLITGVDPVAPPPHAVVIPYYVPYPVFLGGHGPVPVPVRVIPGPILLPLGGGRFLNDGSRRFLNDGFGPPFQGTTPQLPATIPQPRTRHGR